MYKPGKLEHFYVWSVETLDGVIIELPLHKRNIGILTIQNWKLLEVGN